MLPSPCFTGWPSQGSEQCFTCKSFCRLCWFSHQLQQVYCEHSWHSIPIIKSLSVPVGNTTNGGERICKTRYVAYSLIHLIHGFKVKMNAQWHMISSWFRWKWCDNDSTAEKANKNPKTQVRSKRDLLKLFQTSVHMIIRATAFPVHSTKNRRKVKGKPSLFVIHSICAELKASAD